MREQLRSMGAMWDWKREAVSADPEYYRWTEWFFLQLFKHDLAYRKKAAVDFCPQCNTTLAREQVWGEDRHCERCETGTLSRPYSPNANSNARRFETSVSAVSLAAIRSRPMPRERSL